MPGKVSSKEMEACKKKPLVKSLTSHSFGLFVSFSHGSRIKILVNQMMRFCIMSKIYLLRIQKGYVGCSMMCKFIIEARQLPVLLLIKKMLL